MRNSALLVPVARMFWHFPAIEARCQPDFFVTGTPPGAQVSGQRSARRRRLNTHQGFELGAVDANADTNIDDRIERGR